MESRRERKSKMKISFRSCAVREREYLEEEEEEDQREMARTKETKRMEPSAETDKSHLRNEIREML